MALYWHRMKRQTATFRSLHHCVGPLADGKAVFCVFLKSEFCEENMEFWLACEDFKAQTSQEAMASKANSIYEEFIRSEAPKEVRGSKRLSVHQTTANVRGSLGLIDAIPDQLGLPDQKRHHPEPPGADGHLLRGGAAESLQPDGEQLLPQVHPLGALQRPVPGCRC